MKYKDDVLKLINTILNINGQRPNGGESEDYYCGFIEGKDAAVYAVLTAMKSLVENEEG